MSGLLYLAVKGAQRNLANDGFTYRPNIETIREQYLKKAEPVKAWADARCGFSSECQEGIDKQRIHADFVSYCQRTKLPAVDLAHLARRVKALGYDVSDARIGPRGA